ncbi:MAG: sugar ABC transporter permease [Ktedonobacteraceae bacterium]|nr:sugar ABC transporter permease [Ktedonobacteraceae bacterium]
MALSIKPPRSHPRSQPQAQSRQGRPRSWSRYRARTFYLFVAPWVLGFLALTLLPLLYALAISFTDFDGISPRWHVVGLENYANLLRDADTWYSLSRTLLYTVITVPLSVAGGLGLALLLNQRLKARGVFRTIFYLPSIVPVVASAIMWRFIFERDAGALNGVLEWLHIPILTWLVDPLVFYALIIMVLWGLGGGMVILLAGLQGIPAELHEAALVDGANSWQAFWNVTFPQLSPVIFFEVITGVIAALQTLVQPLVLAQANQVSGLGVPRSNFLYMVNVYQQFFTYQHFGYGSAMLWVFFVIILLVTLLVFRSSSFWVYYEVDRDR